jgi:carbamoyl-phosphate synthase large subunit
MVNLAVRLAMAAYTGEQLDLTTMKRPKVPFFGVKEAVFPFNMFPEVDPVLGPEMRSTGEVLGLSDSFGLAFCKALEGGKTILPLSGSVLFSVTKKDREQTAEAARQFESLGFKIVATKGTYNYLTSLGIKAEFIKKMYEGRPNIDDAIKNRHLDIIINTPSGKKRSADDDSYIRKSAIRHNIPYMTTLTAALAGVKGIAEKLGKSGEEIHSLQDYHLRIEEK